MQDENNKNKNTINQEVQEVNNEVNNLNQINNQMNLIDSSDNENGNENDNENDNENGNEKDNKNDNENENSDKSDKYSKMIQIIDKVKFVISQIPFIKIKKSYLSFSEVFKINFLVLEVLISNSPFKFVLLYQDKYGKIYADQAILRIKEFIGKNENIYGIVVAPYLNEAKVEIYKNYGIGGIDYNGNIFLSFKNVFVDKRNDLGLRIINKSEPENKSLKSLFSPKSSRVFRVMLINPFKKFYVKDLSKITGVSIGLVSKIKQEMSINGWIEENKKTFFIKDIKTAELILDEWAKNYSFKKYNKVHYFFNKSLDSKSNGAKNFIANEWLKSFCNTMQNDFNYGSFNYALTLFSGAYEVLKNIPDKEMINNNKLFFYIKYTPLNSTSKIDPLYDLKMEFDLARVSSSRANFIVLEESKNNIENLNKEGDYFEDEPSLDEDYADKLGKDVFYKIQTVKNEFEKEPNHLIRYETKVVSDIQLYLDLYKIKGGEEIAQKILEERIKPTWKDKEKIKS
jgi:hypothetical protein